MAGEVAVIIPAYRAAWCIGEAISSALSQPEVGEVWVVDDASGDDTVDAARQADDGTGRLRLLVQERNQGPAAARNRALAECSAPIVALLDSDDRILPGRFTRLLAIKADWDFLADDIVFASDSGSLAREASQGAASPLVTRKLELTEFVERNISRRGRRRSELGFLKPLMKRDFLRQHHLIYDERLRLGEDFILYAQALLAGGSFLLASSCGYGAIEREGSLSGNHSAQDLAALAAASRSLAVGLEQSAERKALQRHAAALEAKAAHRQFLDQKRQSGLLGVVARHMTNPVRLLKVGQAIALDKVAPHSPAELPRRLFSHEEFDQA